MSTRGDAETLREAALTWIAYARSDLALARSPAPPAEVLPEALCYHAQQAVEKAIKAVLVAHDIDFPKSHDIAALRGLLPPILRLDPSLREAATLTDYAVAARYPGEREPLDPGDVVRASELAAAVVSWAEASIGRLAKPGGGISPG
jgi:HEPN domain-containing protein